MEKIKKKRNRQLKGYQPRLLKWQQRQKPTNRNGKSKNDFEKKVIKKWKANIDSDSLKG